MQFYIFLNFHFRQCEEDKDGNIMESSDTTDCSEASLPITIKPESDGETMLFISITTIFSCKHYIT